MKSEMTNSCIKLFKKTLLTDSHNCNLATVEGIGPWPTPKLKFSFAIKFSSKRQDQIIYLFTNGFIYFINDPNLLAELI